MGQHLFVGPAAVAEPGPGIVVAGLAADVQHGVDRARTAQHLAARNRQAPVAGARLGLRVEAPVDAWAVDHLPEADGHMDEGMPITGAGFEQQHAVARVRAKPVGQHATGGAGADDDVVELLHAAPDLPIPQGTSGHRDAPAAACEVSVLRAPLRFQAAPVEWPHEAGQLHAAASPHRSGPSRSRSGSRHTGRCLPMPDRLMHRALEETGSRHFRRQGP